MAGLDDQAPVLCSVGLWRGKWGGLASAPHWHCVGLIGLSRSHLAPGQAAFDMSNRADTTAVASHEIGVCAVRCEMSADRSAPSCAGRGVHRLSRVEPPVVADDDHNEGDETGKKTYNTKDSLVVTDPTTSLAVTGLSMGERTGSRAFQYLWSYVVVVCRSVSYQLATRGAGSSHNLPSSQEPRCPKKPASPKIV
ncbi:hypothetical protein B0T16DRAFT_200446 [Cercophora newfieldiana]|uniref:Uncharacterized protein n=1 Tax=Cercophora newfieldiana TaxID=92897 RepID=A0AA39XUR4_9PEZI|nr:hypothetical protein B0T16DRAFT_200446 [Cercophora newfieldiana]